MRYVALAPGTKPKHTSNLKKYSTYLVEDGYIGLSVEMTPDLTAESVKFTTIVRGSGKIELLDELKSFLTTHFLESVKIVGDANLVEIFCPSKNLAIRCSFQYAEMDEKFGPTTKIVWFDSVSSKDTTTFISTTHMQTPKSPGKCYTTQLFPLGHDQTLPPKVTQVEHFLKDYKGFVSTVFKSIPELKAFVSEGVDLAVVSEVVALRREYLSDDKDKFQKTDQWRVAVDKLHGQISNWDKQDSSLDRPLPGYPGLDLLAATFL